MRCRFDIEVDAAKAARRIAKNNMRDKGIDQFRILRVQRCNLVRPDCCEVIGYRVYVEYNDAITV